MIPGEIITQPGDIELNAGRDTIIVSVANTGDRPIQIDSSLQRRRLALGTVRVIQFAKSAFTTNASAS